MKARHWSVGVLSAGALGVLGYAGARYALTNPVLRPPLRDAYHAARETFPGLKLRGESGGAETSAYPLEQAETPLTIYADGLQPGWADWSWASHKIGDEARAKDGGGENVKTLSMVAADYKGVYLAHTALAIGGYGALEFRIWLLSGAENAVGVFVVGENKKPGSPLPLKNYTAAAMADKNGWRKIVVPLTDFGLKKESGVIAGVGFQSLKAGNGPTIYLNDIRLTTDGTLPLAISAETIPVTVDVKADNKAISPLIYGMAFAAPEEARSYGVALNRWGGNPNSRYNWVADCWNAARDWQFRNYGWKNGIDPKKRAGASADSYIEGNRKAGAATLFTIPTIGWAAKDGLNAHRSLAVPKRGDLPLGAFGGPIAGYDPAANRAGTSVRSRARKGHPFETYPVAPVKAGDGTYEIYQDEFVAHLTKKFGAAKSGGVRFYAMDNEPDLWAHTHTDVQPALPGYDDLLARFYEYASAVKAVDESAEVTGPVSWGWTGYILSPQDTTKERLFTRPDRKAHGDEPFLLWFLKAVRKKDEAASASASGGTRRTLDVLDIHYYPQQSGVYSNRADGATRKLRLRATRALWDASYRDESWINESVELIPRMKRWIAEGYPGTHPGITEWNFGAEKDISGGLATADALGIFGREGLYLANYWTKPGRGSFTAAAFLLYRNPENRGTAGGGFGDISCRAVSPYPDRLSIYAALDSKSGALTIILVNKMSKATLTAPLVISNGDGRGVKIRRYAFSEASPNITASAGPILRDGKTTLILPPYSATLLRAER